MKYEVVKAFDGHEVGDIIELNDRRAKSEMAYHQTVIPYKQSKVSYKTKEEKLSKKTK